MNITNLKYFLTIAETLHLTQAAEQMNISEPAMSKAISRLEDEIGYKLFDRIGRNIYLNKNGKLFLPYVQSAIENINKGLDELSVENSLSSNSLIIQSIPLTFFPGLITGVLKADFSTQFINSFKITAHEMEENLLTGKTDLCFTTQELHSKELSSILLYSDPVILVVSNQHSFCKKECVEVNNILNESFIKCVKYTGLDVDFNYVFSKLSRKPRTLALASNETECLEYISANKGVAVLRLMFFKDAIRRNYCDLSTIQIVDCEQQPVCFNYKLYYRKHQNNLKQKGVVNAFRSYFNNYSSLINKRYD